MLPHWTPSATLLLSLDPRAWAPLAPLRLDGIAFAPKPELHATIVGRALGARLQRAMSRDATLRARVDALCAGLDWAWARRRQWWLLEQREPAWKASIVEVLALPAMTRFHAGLGDLLDCALPVPPPHVTLHTAGHDAGIGVPDPATWARRVVRRVQAAELASG